MAGDWIKMDTELPDKPEVIRMSGLLGMDRFAIVGRLHRLWSWWNKHTADGHAPGVTETFLDELVNRDGFSAALREVDWLQARSGSLVVPRFDRHNGNSAKSRVQAAERQKLSRSNRDTCHADTVTKTRPEKRRVEKSINPPLPPEGEMGGVLPERWRNIPKIDRRNHKCLKNSPLMERIGGWFNRRPGTIWPLAEGITLHAIEPHPEDVDLIESYYLAEIHGELDFRRHDLATLLNNWQGEVDRARIWKSEQ